MRVGFYIEVLVDGEAAGVLVSFMTSSPPARLRHGLVSACTERVERAESIDGDGAEDTGVVSDIHLASADSAAARVASPETESVFPICERR